MSRQMQTDGERLRQHVQFLAAEPRPSESQRLEECREYCRRQLSASGWQTEERRFTAESAVITRPWNGVNLVARHPEQFIDNRPVFVLGAHLDSHAHTPGADDNASAVAALLEVCRVLGEEISSGLQTAVNAEIVIFDLEEMGILGGAFHAETCRRAGICLRGMVSLEMLGYCSHEPGSQQFPEVLQGLYPDVGDFIAVVGNQNSANLIRSFDNGFAAVPGLKHESLQVPEDGRTLPPTRLSDHSPFWDAGFPAVMVTDTSYMRNPHYHETGDVPETLDYEFLHLVTEGVLDAVRQILSNPDDDAEQSVGE